MTTTKKVGLPPGLGTVEVSGDLLVIASAVGEWLAPALARVDQVVRIRLLVSQGVLRHPRASKFTRTVHALGSDVRAVEVRVLDEIPGFVNCAVADGARIYPRPEDVMQNDLRANLFMLNIGVGEDEQKAIDEAEALWERGEPTDCRVSQPPTETTH